MEKQQKYNYKIICIKSPKWLGKLLRKFANSLFRILNDLDCIGNIVVANVVSASTHSSIYKEIKISFSFLNYVGEGDHFTFDK